MIGLASVVTSVTSSDDQSWKVHYWRNIVKLFHTISNMNAYQATSRNPGRSWDRMASAGLTFRAKDGYVVMAGVRSEERWRQLWQMAGREELLEDPRYLGQGGDGEFYFHQVIPAIEKWSQSYTTWEVVEKLTDIGFSMGVAQKPI